MKKILLALIFLFFLASLISVDSYAAVLFEDDFEDGDSNGWTTLLGPNIWEVREIGGNKMFGARINSGSTLMDTVAATINTPNYQIDFDYMPVTGADRNLDFRWIRNPDDNGYTPYEVHYLGSNYSFNNFGATPINIIPLIDNQVNHIKIILENQRVQFFVNQVKIIDHVVPDYEFTSEKVGLRLSTGASFPTEGWFDNVKATTLDHDDEQGLNVPLLKQTDPPWADDIYDSANLWWPSDPSISRWGCAVTSATMVLKYHNIDKLPDGNEVTPGTLNSYLSSSDGYLRNGSTYWPVIADMTYLAKSQNPDFEHEALQIKWGSNNQEQLKDDISNNIPDILELDMGGGNQHFVVARGIDNGKVIINDPGFDREDLSEYNDTYVSTRRFIPSNTDLSYIVLAVDPSVDIGLIKSSTNESVGEVVFEGPIWDIEDSVDNQSGPLKVLYFPEPDSGEYKLNITSQNGNSYILDQYFHDTNGEHKKITANGNLSNGGTNTYTISFDKDDSNNSTSELVMPVTFESIRQKIKDGYKDGKIKFGTHIALLVELEIAERAKKEKISQGSLSLMIFTLERDKRVDGDFGNELIEDIQTLKDSL